MRRYGVEEKEARILYHLWEAEDLFRDLDEPRRKYRSAAPLAHLIFISPHFNALRQAVGSRTLSRDYPDGWGSSQTSEDS